jgi:hypothetical protein
MRRQVNYYNIWVNLRESGEDLAFAHAVHAYLGTLVEQGLLESFTLARRKLGFGPGELGEFHVRLCVRDMRQLEDAFERIAARGGDLERLHADVYSRVTDFRSALYRDFPDPERGASPG